MNYRQNLLELRAFWKTVPRTTVDLGIYSCDGLYCIGGHVAAARLFDVVPDERGFPCLYRGEAQIRGTNVAEELFGCWKLFEARGRHQIDDAQGYWISDWELALKRIDFEIWRLGNANNTTR